MMGQTSPKGVPAPAPAAARAEPRPGRLAGLFPPAAHLGWANLTTTAAAGAGVAGILAAAGGHVRLALTLLCAAAIFDHFDGPIARRLGETSPFGGELDSLSDALAFCALPAVLLRSLAGGGAPADAAAVVYALCGLWRLAHFNVHGMSERRFIGLPTPHAAGWVLVLSPLLLHLPAAARPAAAAALASALALLMVSRLPIGKDGLEARVLRLLGPAVTVLLWLWRP